MAEINTVIAEASQDLQTIEDFVNLPAGSDVRPRLLPSVNVGTLAGTRDAIFRAGGLPAEPFPTLAKMQTEGTSLADGQLAMVYNETANNGLYVKTAGAWVKADYDPLTQAKTYIGSAIRDSETGFLDKSYNLFDASKAKIGQFITATGSISTNPAYSVSDYIKVSASTTYTMSSASSTQPAFATVNYFDTEKVFISRVVVGETAGSKSFTTPANTAYIRLNIYDGLPSENSRMLNEGSVALAYQPFKTPTLKNVSLSASNVQQVAESLNITDTAKPYITPSKNLFDYTKTTPNSVISDTGEISAPQLENTYQISDFIPVVGGDKYTISGALGTYIFIHTAYYTSNKEFIRRVDSRRTGESPSLTLTIPSNAAYVRFNINQGLPSENNRMFNKGEEALPYEKGGAVLSGVKLAPDIIAQVGASGGADLTNNFVVSSNNLFDYDTATVNKNILDTGEVVDSVSYSLSDYIPVKPSTKYTMSGSIAGIDAFIYTSYFTAGKNFIRRESTKTRDTGKLTITTPPNAAFIRFSINGGLPSYGKRMFNVGDVALPYEKGGTSKLTGVVIADDVMSDINRKIKPNPDDKYMLDLPVNAVYDAGKDFSGYPDFNNIQSSAVYAMYDDLMSEHTEYITKQFLGNDAWGNEVSAYKFTPLRPTSTNETIKYPKVFLVTGIHGMEHMPPLSCYLMLREMCKSWRDNELIEALRFNIDLIIIPVANPTGWNRNTRLNDNGVDVNRNFPAGWQLVDKVADPGHFGGTEPASELETQYIMQVFAENPDIDIFYDHHNFNGLSAETHPHFIWVSSQNGSKEYIEHLAQTLITRMTRVWRKRYAWIPQSDTYFAGYTTSGTSAGTLKDYALAQQIKYAATFEVGGKWWIDPTGEKFDANHSRCAVETITNWLLINLHDLTNS